MHARPDGFELTFTEPVDPQQPGDPKSYAMKTYTYIYQASYGSPEVDETEPTMTKATVAADGRSVRLVVTRSGRGPCPRAAPRPASVPPEGNPCSTPSPITRSIRSRFPSRPRRRERAPDAITDRLLNCHYRLAMMLHVRPRPSAAGRGSCFDPIAGTNSVL